MVLILSSESVVTTVIVQIQAGLALFYTCLTVLKCEDYQQWLWRPHLFCLSLQREQGPEKLVTCLSMWYSGNLGPESVTFQLMSVYSDQHRRKTIGEKEQSEQATWFAGAKAKWKCGASYSKNYLKFQDMLQQSILGIGPSVTAQVNISMKQTLISFFYFIIHYFIIY